jgi:hypothetical protein
MVIVWLPVDWAESLTVVWITGTPVAGIPSAGVAATGALPGLHAIAAAVFSE